MPTDIAVTIYYGPRSWFEGQLPARRRRKRTFLLDVVYKRDEEARSVRHIHVLPDGTQAPVGAAAEKPRRPRNVVAGSNDYASLNEHAISNFSGLVRSVRPKRLHLHNPPTQVAAQMQREFHVEVKKFDYPTITPQVLRAVGTGWGGHLMGQDGVCERLMAALYPLIRNGRTKPVVLLLLGPSGVGKTETAHFINGLLGGTLMRKQFSMYHSEKFASYLFGGTHSEPSFAHDLLDRESGVILLDELDKANPTFHSGFYQLFDDGIFEDKNYTAVLGPSLIICTTNYRSEAEAISALGDALCSRFDAVIEYKPLLPEALQQITDSMIEKSCAVLTDGERDRIDVDEIKGWFRKSSGQESNVRRLKKIVNEVIARRLVQTMVDDGDQIESAAS
ncbi:AAA family ATPase [Oerskovia enterophila]|uniref:ATP-dependent Clp protease ATP-binding subunit ClpL n=1 Tax=Oerskovia enterophila TaxID=43678 RepID=A0ABX2Y8J1_9CELL|nr:AAA family ATPase [Oerskovia enterophila]OCI32810.1 ATP-dependent Clp protease ATP-binding subunit ClpL [Oerskovia enterophila]